MRPGGAEQPVELHERESLVEHVRDACDARLDGALGQLEEAWRGAAGALGGEAGDLPARERVV
jgi:hypothetical protein